MELSFGAIGSPVTRGKGSRGLVNRMATLLRSDLGFGRRSPLSRFFLELLPVVLELGGIVGLNKREVYSIPVVGPHVWEKGVRHSGD